MTSIVLIVGMVGMVVGVRDGSNSDGGDDDSSDNDPPYITKSFTQQIAS